VPLFIAEIRSALEVKTSKSARYDLHWSWIGVCLFN
jgi:hypothetical protein